MYVDNIPTDVLPFYCNWIPYPASNNTKFDTKTEKFVEGFTPHHEIGIINLAGGIKVKDEDMRFNKNLTIKIPTTNNSFVEKSFRFNKKK